MYEPLGRRFDHPDKIMPRLDDVPTYPEVWPKRDSVHAHSNPGFAFNPHLPAQGAPPNNPPPMGRGPPGPEDDDDRQGQGEDPWMARPDGDPWHAYRGRQGTTGGGRASEEHPGPSGSGVADAPQEPPGPEGAPPAPGTAQDKATEAPPPEQPPVREAPAQAKGPRRDGGGTPPGPPPRAQPWDFQGQQEEQAPGGPPQGDEAQPREEGVDGFPPFPPDVEEVARAQPPYPSEEASYPSPSKPWTGPYYVICMGQEYAAAQKPDGAPRGGGPDGKAISRLVRYIAFKPWAVRPVEGQVEPRMQPRTEGAQEASAGGAEAHAAGAGRPGRSPWAPYEEEF